MSSASSEGIPGLRRRPFFCLFCCFGCFAVLLVVGGGGKNFIMYCVALLFPPPPRPLFECTGGIELPLHSLPALLIPWDIIFPSFACGVVARRADVKH